MTLETKYFIELKDILQIGIQCGNCKCSLICTLEKFQRTYEVCPNCENPLINKLDQDAIAALIQAVINLSAAESKRPFKISLEIPAPK